MDQSHWDTYRKLLDEKVQKTKEELKDLENKLDGIRKYIQGLYYEIDYMNRTKPQDKRGKP
jgi:hypothetical protein